MTRMGFKFLSAIALALLTVSNISMPAQASAPTIDFADPGTEASIDGDRVFLNFTENPQLVGCNSPTDIMGAGGIRLWINTNEITNSVSAVSTFGVLMIIQFSAQVYTSDLVYMTYTLTANGCHIEGTTTDLSSIGTNVDSDSDGLPDGAEAITNNSNVVADNTAPDVSAAVLGSDGVTLTITFDEGMNAATTPTGFSVYKNAMPLNGVTSGNISQGGTSLVLTLASAQLQGDSLQLWFVQAGDEVEDDSGNDLVSFGQGSSFPITNNSTQQAQQQQSSVLTAPTFTAITNGVPSSTAGTYSGATIISTQFRACPSPVVASTGVAVTLTNVGCLVLGISNASLVAPTNFATAFINLNAGTPYLPYGPEVSNRPHIVFLEQLSDGTSAWTNSILYSGSNSSSSSQDEEEVPPPVYFGGPQIQGSTLPHFTQGEEGTVTLTGKRMSGILSATINGVAVTVTADRRSATITVPDTLAAGTYDLVLQTTNGRLTVMRFIKVS